MSPLPKDLPELDLDAVPTVSGIIPENEAPRLVEVDDDDVESLAVHGCHVAEVLCPRARCPVCGFGVRWPGSSRSTPADVPWAFWRVDEKRIEVVHPACINGQLFEHGAHTAFPIGKLGHDFRERWACILWNVPKGASVDDTALVEQRAWPA